MFIYLTVRNNIEKQFEKSPHATITDVARTLVQTHKPHTRTWGITMMSAAIL